MCNRYVARVIDFHRLAREVKMPAFEEFTEKVNFDPSNAGASPGGACFDNGSSAHLLNFYTPQEEVAPTDSHPVVRVVNNELRIDLLKWGLIPPHATTEKLDYTTYNARAETISTTRAYRHAWEHRQRCLIPLEAYFEWQGAKAPKQKFRIGIKGESQFCVAGLWEKWQRPGKALETFTMITTVANELAAKIHDKNRMPVILRPADYNRWLLDTNNVSELLQPYPAELMEAAPVPSRRKLPRNQGPGLFAPNE